jgi:leader peptidase (prepilin peptidase)/N-methyltransferase
VTLPWIIAGAAAGLIAGPRICASVFSRSTEPGQPSRCACPACANEIIPARWRWRSLLPVTGRCPSCRTRIGPYPLLAELAAGLALAVVAARASSAWELAARSVSAERGAACSAAHRAGVSARRLMAYPAVL